MDLYLIIYNILISSILIGCNNSDLVTCKKYKGILTSEKTELEKQNEDLTTEKPN